jgi:N6-L-threonylcarbamoyladenine synthase
MTILAIETSCDETAIALCKTSGGLRAPKIAVLSEVVASQIDVHREFGGVVPNLAKREHIANLPIVLEKTLKKISRDESGKPKGLDMIAVTVGPGLEPALWAGIEFAKKLGTQWNVPVVGANHLEGHLYSFLLAKKAEGPKLFPAVALIVSGGHTILISMNSLASRAVIGETLDDAAGECFDKVARMLELPYPGGVEIERLAKTGNPGAIAFPRPMIHAANFSFSFSGLKTSVLYYLKNNPDTKKADVAASFQASVIDVLVYKTLRGAEAIGAHSIFFSGGVAANRTLRSSLSRAARKAGMSTFVAPFRYNTDNAVMIALAAYIGSLRRKKLPLVARGTLGIS